MDEIIGSTGLTGAVDGTMILKRDRGQNEATLFVTGRDVEHEQQLALNFDTSTAQWTLVGNADELRCTRARQEILDLLCEQNPDGMHAREIAEALQKNYHTTRSLLRKMEEAGEVRRSNGRYIATAIEVNPGQRQLPAGSDQQKQYEQQHSKNCEVVEESACQTNNDERDDDDYSDYADDTFDISTDSHTEGINHSEMSSIHLEQVSTCLREGFTLQQEEHQSKENPVINCQSCNQRNQCNHRNQILEPIAEEETQGVHLYQTDIVLQKEQTERFLLKERCPHHQHAHLVRFDPAGQAWCDKMDCWDCYRLMKIGEALEYRCLTDLGGKVVIEEGMDAWSVFVRASRAFLIVVATEEAIAMCKALDIEVPDVSDEVKRLVEVRPAPS